MEKPAPKGRLSIGRLDRLIERPEKKTEPAIGARDGRGGLLIPAERNRFRLFQFFERPPASRRTNEGEKIHRVAPNATAF